MVPTVGVQYNENMTVLTLVILHKMAIHVPRRFDTSVVALSCPSEWGYSDTRAMVVTASLPG